MFIMKLFVGIVILLAVICHAGKSKKPTTTRTSSTRTSTTFRLPADRGLDEWKAMSRESLILQCNAVNIQATGSQSTLATRLFEQFHQNLVVNPPINIAIVAVFLRWLIRWLHYRLQTKRTSTPHRRDRIYKSSSG